MTSPEKPRPLNPRQRAFGRELGIDIAEGRRTFERAYARAGFRAHRGNAARLAADPRVREIADHVAHEAVRLAGLHLAYLQAKGLELLHANVFDLHRQITQAVGIDGETGKVTFVPLSPEAEARLIAATFPLSELKLGEVTVKVNDKRSVIETLLRTMPGGMAAERRELTGKDGGPIERRDVGVLSDAELEAIARQGQAA